jgi:pilus assembly protein Flp/PilA
MRQFVQQVVEFLKKEDGPTAVEYAVMLSLIIVVCLAAISVLGQNASAKFSTVATSIASSS